MKRITKMVLPPAALGAAVLAVGLLTGAHPSQAEQQAELVAAEPSASDCPLLLFYGARGSGEGASGFGPEVQQFQQKLGTLSGTAPALQGIADGAAIAVDYPAIAVGYDLKDYTEAYNKSVAAGEKALNTDLLAEWQHCPDTYVVLAGYSQGAQVVGDVADGLSQHWRTHIAAVALFGDPDFNPLQPKVDAINDYLPLTGISPYLRLLGEKDLLRWVPSDLAPRFHSYCIPYDPICNFTPQMLAECGVAIATHTNLACPHLDYVTLRWPAQAAYWAAGVISTLPL